MIEVGDFNGSTLNLVLLLQSGSGGPTQKERVSDHHNPPSEDLNRDDYEASLNAGTPNTTHPSRLVLYALHARRLLGTVVQTAPITGRNAINTRGLGRRQEGGPTCRGYHKPH